MRTLGLIAVLLIGLAGGAYFWVGQNGYEVTISKAQLQERVDAKLPFNGTKGPLQYTVSRAAVDLRADGRIAVDADVGVSVLGQKVAANIQGSGVLEYRETEFFLQQVQVENATIAKDPNKTGGLGALAGPIEDVLRQNGGAILNAVLEKQPVFRLKDTVKHNVAKMTLEKVEVRNQTLVVTLNPFKGQ